MSDEVIEQDQVEQPSTLRQELESAFEASESEPAPAAPVAAPEVEPAAVEAADGRARDESGRFRPKEKAEGAHGAAPKAGVAPAGGTPPAAQPVVEAQPAAAAERAPQSWRPAAREHWAALPPDVRSEVQRREREVAQTLQETAEARKTALAFQEAVRPYEHMIRAEGGDAMRAVGNLFQTAAALRTAPPGQRAQLVARIVQAYGVPIDALDAALSGQAMPQHQHQQQGPMMDPRVDQLLAQVEEAKTARAQAIAQESSRTVEEFGAKQDFFEDVRETMADLLEVADRRGQRLSLDDAYKRAVAMDPEISNIVQQREAAKAAANRARSTQRAKVAASSVRSNTPSAPKADKGDQSLRDSIEESFAQLSGR